MSDYKGTGTMGAGSPFPDACAACAGGTLDCTTCGGKCDGPCEEHEEACALEMLNALRADLAHERGEVASLTRERDAYKRAKQENDERFMNERDTARAEVSKLKLELETEKGFETILNLEREHRDRLSDALKVARVALEEIVAEDYLVDVNKSAVAIADKAIANISAILLEEEQENDNSTATK
jgi:hypothetical protein